MTSQQRKDIRIEIQRIDGSHHIYKGVCTDTKEVLFQKRIECATDGIVEFIGAVHALMLIKQKGWNKDVYVRNKYIKECIEEKQYKYSVSSQQTNELIRRCIMFLLDQKQKIIIYIYE